MIQWTLNHGGSFFGVTEMTKALGEQIEQNAAMPQLVTVDGQTVRQHPLPDQIAADKYLAAKQATGRKRFGLRILRAKMPNALGG